MSRIYIGDRQLEPDDEPEYCEYCDGFDVIYPADGSDEYPCPECQGDSDPGEPNEDPE